MPTFDNAKDLERHLKKALDALQAEVLITTQAELGSAAVSPVDTGRFRSSWFAAEGSASNDVAPGADAKDVAGLGRRRAKAKKTNDQWDAIGKLQGASQAEIDKKKSKAGAGGLGSYGPNSDATDLQVDSNKEYHLTNNLPYAQSICLEGKAVSKPKNWFLDFVNVRVPKIQNAAVRVVKAEFEL